jgi:hypothetical protein
MPAQGNTGWKPMLPGIGMQTRIGTGSIGAMHEESCSSSE